MVVRRCHQTVIEAAAAAVVALPPDPCDCTPVPDDDFSSVVLLAHLDTDPPVDSSSREHSLTIDSGGKIQTDIFKFCPAAFDAENSVDGRISASDSEDWRFTDQPFTVECQVYWHVVPTDGESMVGQLGPSSQASWWISWSQIGPAFKFVYSVNGVSQIEIGTDNFTPEAGRWYAFAADRDSADDVRVYIDGVQRGLSNIGSDSFKNSTSDLTIGNLPSGAALKLNGVIDEVRVTKGVARYAGSYTPATCKFGT